MKKEKIIKLEITEQDFHDLMYLLGFVKGYIGSDCPEHFAAAEKLIITLKKLFSRTRKIGANEMK